MAFYWNTVALLGSTCWGEIDIFKQVRTVNRPMDRGGSSFQIPFLVLLFGLAWACPGPVRGVTVSVSTYVQLPCYV